jgi:hypothetical protein
VPVCVRLCFRQVHEDTQHVRLVLGLDAVADTAGLARVSDAAASVEQHFGTFPGELDEPGPEQVHAVDRTLQEVARLVWVDVAVGMRVELATSVGTRPEIADAPGHARALREKTEKRERSVTSMSTAAACS